MCGRPVQVIASVTDNSLRVWEARHGAPQHTLCGHQADAYILESHPREPRILMSAGYDGRVLLWDVVSGSQLARWTLVLSIQRIHRQHTVQCVTPHAHADSRSSCI